MVVLVGIRQIIVNCYNKVNHYNGLSPNAHVTDYTNLQKYDDDDDDDYGGCIFLNEYLFAFDLVFLF